MKGLRSYWPQYPPKLADSLARLSRIFNGGVEAKIPDLIQTAPYFLIEVSLIDLTCISYNLT